MRQGSGPDQARTGEAPGYTRCANISENSTSNINISASYHTPSLRSPPLLHELPSVRPLVWLCDQVAPLCFPPAITYRLCLLGDRISPAACFGCGCCVLACLPIFLAPACHPCSCLPFLAFRWAAPRFFLIPWHSFRSAITYRLTTLFFFKFLLGILGN